jgi:UDP-glucose 4-epimerase
MRVAVTGASGNLGTSVLAALGELPEVESIVGIARRRPAVSLQKVTWEVCDVARGDLDSSLAGADAVISLAWAIQPSRDPALLHEINVEGSRRTFEAAARCGAKALLYASSVGTYAAVGPGEAEQRMGEDWPATGIPTSLYSSQKAEVETLLDRFESDNPQMAVTRIRPALIFKREASSEIRRLFAGPFFPNALLRGRLPIVPLPRGLRVQCVHADDVASAFALALSKKARGAFNVAAEPQLGPAELAAALGGRPLAVPPAPVRAFADLTWRARLQPTPAGWFDLGMGVPAMDTNKARGELGWQPRTSADDALRELLEGLADGAGGATPPLAAQAGGRFRSRELRTGVGARP